MIKNRVSIDLRPSVVDNKERFRDWEIDTIMGKNNKGAILTIVERKSAFLLMQKLNGKNADDLARAAVRLLAPYKEKVHTITSDNGSEFADHQTIAKKLQAEFYFTHPYSAWEKGVNENMNGLIRQYIPKNTWFKILTMQQIKQIERELNNRPRKTLGWKTPLQVFMANFQITLSHLRVESAHSFLCLNT
jgi:IS30 family transposase